MVFAGNLDEFWARPARGDTPPALQVRHSLAIGNDLQHLAAGERELAPTFLR